MKSVTLLTLLTIIAGTTAAAPARAQILCTICSSSPDEAGFGELLAVTNSGILVGVGLGISSLALGIFEIYGSVGPGLSEYEHRGVGWVEIGFGGTALLVGGGVALWLALRVDDASPAAYAPSIVAAAIGATFVGLGIRHLVVSASTAVPAVSVAPMMGPAGSNGAQGTLTWSF